MSCLRPLGLGQTCPGHSLHDTQPRHRRSTVVQDRTHKPARGRLRASCPSPSRWFSSSSNSSVCQRGRRSREGGRGCRRQGLGALAIMHRRPPRSRGQRCQQPEEGLSAQEGLRHGLNWGACLVSWEAKDTPNEVTRAAGGDVPAEAPAAREQEPGGWREQRRLRARPRPGLGQRERPAASHVRGGTRAGSRAEERPEGPQRHRSTDCGRQGPAWAQRLLGAPKPRCWPRPGTGHVVSTGRGGCFLGRVTQTGC